MRRRDNKPHSPQLPDESWGEWLKRVYPRGCRREEVRLDRSERRTARRMVAGAKAEYRRRRRWRPRLPRL